MAVGNNCNGCHRRLLSRKIDAQYSEWVTTLDNFATGLATSCLSSNSRTEKEQTTQEHKTELHTKLQTSPALSHWEWSIGEKSPLHSLTGSERNCLFTAGRMRFRLFRTMSAP